MRRKAAHGNSKKKSIVHSLINVDLDKLIFPLQNVRSCSSQLFRFNFFFNSFRSTL